MRLSRVVLFVAIASLMAGSLAAETGGLRYSVTVAKFENKAGWSGRFDIGDAWGTVLTDLLNQSGKFIVLGEKDMRTEALGEQDFAASGRTAGGNKAPVTGQMTPAQLLVKGAITHVQDDTGGGGGGLSVGGIRVGGKGGKGEVNATIYIVDSTTGQILASKSVTGVSTRKGLAVGINRGGISTEAGGYQNDNVGKAVSAACAEAVNFMVAQLPKVPWTGTVVQSANGKVYVNRGSREGVTVGQSFVVGEAEVIRDPDSGEVLDTSIKEVARLEVSEVREKLSVCKVSSGKAASVRKGMAVHAQ
ncbi:MAG TPA: CsgG/HfaB family protein [Thermoanaerobaculia bacterium]|nr:CsgG/HfaB family protein [Thermoanaerobaculia bacterium]